MTSTFSRLRTASWTFWRGHMWSAGSFQSGHFVRWIALAFVASLIAVLCKAVADITRSKQCLMKGGELLRRKAVGSSRVCQNLTVIVIQCGAGVFHHTL